jgi:S-adenosylmethionine decarboxylase
MHVLFDGYDARGPLMRDCNAILSWLDALPPKIGMRVLMPAVGKLDEPPRCKLIDSGFSAVVLLAESHASIHCWPVRDELQFDLYSCKPFNPQEVLIELITAFGIGDWDFQTHPRRKREPTHG